MRPNATVVVEGDRVAHVAFDGGRIDDAEVHDLGGRALLPGLIDAHVHVTAVDHDPLRLAAMPPSLITAQAKGVLEGMLARGFTSVRDAAGADFGLREAIEQGLLAGPRLYISGQPLSQTGGHGDVRPRGAQAIYCTCAGLGLFGAIADGVDAVRKAAREQLRNGADQVKVMASGGILSPTDPVEGTQYSLEELRAICEEAEAHGTYVMAHAYSPAAIQRAVQSGVRSIEHGNLLDEGSARAMKQHGAFLVPTLATYAAFADPSVVADRTPLLRAKLQRVQTQGIRAIAIAKAEGIPIAFGTDLLGAMHGRQTTEYALRLPAMTPAEILRSATSVAADLLGESGRIGVVAPGALADLLVVEGDPTRDLAPLQAPEWGLRAVMKDGRFYLNRL